MKSTDRNLTIIKKSILPKQVQGNTNIVFPMFLYSYKLFIVINIQ